MRKIILFLILSQISLINYGQIIANHTIVSDFDKIPASYIAEVKKMMVSFPGESHSVAYRTGMELLEALYPAYTCNVASGESYTDQYLRVDAGLSAGEKFWYTWYAYPSGSRPAVSNTIKSAIESYSYHDHPMHVLGFGWCYDMIAGSTSSSTDASYGCHWYGWSDGGPNGDLCWGLDGADNSITGNAVCMDTYLGATEDYISYCKSKGYVTKVIFTTGPVDLYYAGESGYQGYLKHEYIRNYVKDDASRILFDYADILCYDDDGSINTITWNGHTYPAITATNLGAANIGHIGSSGAIRLAKAQWWLLARIAGWNGVTSTVPVTSIAVTGAGGATTISTTGGTLQLSAAILPANASNKSVTWTVANGTGQATISTGGLVTAVADGTVTARATANDGSGVYGTLVITETNQVISCERITFNASSGTITDNSGSSDYQNNMTCEKLIQPTGGGTITLTFTAFSTEASYDLVRVYAGSTTSAPLLGTFSGSTLPPVLTSSGGSMLIRFTTDGSVVAAGWSATYTSGPPPPTGCINETFTTASGTITDNSGSSNYQNNMACEKLIQPIGGGKITLTFSSFSTESGYDFVRVYDGSTTSATLLGTYSGNSLPPALMSKTGSMLIRFTTDGSVVAVGWIAIYTSSAHGGKGISELEILQDIKLVAYPNPTSGILTIKSSVSEEETYTIDLINVSGQVILNQRRNVIGGKFDIDISNVRSGSYMLRIKTGRTVQFIRAIKY